MRKIIVVFAFLISGLVFGQTTVTLEDQCNCEVLSGPDVTAPGMITPAGADLGDIYVNTNTGTIYFWDGDSWELTSTDLNTTNATLTEDGTSLILTDSDNNSVSILLSDIASSIDTNTTNVTFTVNNGTGTLDIMDSDSNLVSVALSDIATAVNTDNQTLSEVLADGNDGGGAAIINIANPTNAQDAATKAYVDALDTDDADSDPNNEIQDLEDVIAEDPSAGNNTITNLANPTNAQDAATKAYVDALDTDDADSDPNNEIQDLEDVIGEDPSAGNNAITNLANPTNAQDAATKAYVDALDTDDADSDPNNEIQDLEDVIGEDPSAGNNAITDLANPTNAQDAATKAYVDALDTDDADSDPNNEIQDLEDVIGEDPSAGNNVITNLANPTNAQDAATKAYVDALDTDDADSDPTNELTNTGLGGPTGSPVNGTTYVDTDTGQLYVYDGTWHQVGGSATPAADIVTTLSTIDNITYTYISEDNTSTSFDGTDDQDGDEVALDDIGNNFTTDNVEAALAELAGRTDNDTQYTAGSGLDLTGTVFSAEISSTSGNALSVDANGLYVSNVDNVNDADSVIGNESVTNLAFDGTTLTLTQDGAANRTVNLSAVDTNTQYTAGSGLDLTGTVFSAEISSTAGNALSVDANGLYVSNVDNVNDADSVIGNESVTNLAFDGTTLTLTQDGAANRTVNLSAVDTNTQYTAGSGLDLSGTVFSADISSTAGNALSVDANGLYVSDSNTQYTAGSGLDLTGTVFSAEISSTSGNALSVDANGLYVSNVDNVNDADSVIGNESVTNLAFDGTTLTLTQDGAANRTVNLSAVDTNTQYTAGSGLDLTGTVFSADISGTAGNILSVDGDGLYATQSDDQYDDEVPLRVAMDVDDAGKIAAEVSDETNVQEVIQAIAPITSKAARIFYPPSIAIDASTVGTDTVDLYAQYLDQFGSPMVASSGPGAGNTAPSAIPTYSATELYYYVTYADVDVFGNGTTVQNMSIDENGVLSYEVFNQPADYNSLINVVFVVK